MTHQIGNFIRLCIMIYVFMFAYDWWKPAPEFFLKSDETHLVPESGVHFIADATFVDKDGVQKFDQHIWDQVYSTIDRAEHSLLLNFFLFNDFQFHTPQVARSLVGELTDKLLAKKSEDKHVAIALITDPINTLYGGTASPQIEHLKKSGIFVIESDMNSFPDSDLFWTAFWKPFVSWWGNSLTGGWLPHPLSAAGNKVTLRSWLHYLNFKSNERNLVVADEPIMKGGKMVGQKMVTIITSANPSDAQSADDNVALKIDDHLWKSVVENESLVAHYSNSGLPSFATGVVSDATGTIAVTLLREEAIRTKVLKLLESARYGDHIDLMLKHIADRKVINALAETANRGVQIRVILDPNINSPRLAPTGIPNRPAAKELTADSIGDIQIQWCKESCNAKFMLGKTATSSFLLLGSADFTRRSIGGFNLNADVFVERNKTFAAWKDASSYFDRLWENKNGQYTLPYASYEDNTFWNTSLYRMMERTGISSF